MAWGTKKTEHVGAKKGTGAFYGRKADAKRGSNHRRRQEFRMSPFLCPSLSIFMTERPPNDVYQNSWTLYPL